MNKITPFLWFKDDAEEAVELYVSVFQDAEILNIARWGEGGPVPAGTALVIEFRLGELEYRALNAGEDHPFTDAVSFMIHCDTQDEVDGYWDKLTADGGEPGPCGWLKDKYGLSWQVVPNILGELMSDPDQAKAGRVMGAMMQMSKIEIAGLQEAANQAA